MFSGVAGSGIYAPLIAMRTHTYDREERKALPVHQLSNRLLWHLFAINGGVLSNQTALEALLSDEVPLLIDTKGLILRSDPALEISGGRHERRGQYDILNG